MTASKTASRTPPRTASKRSRGRGGEPRAKAARPRLTVPLVVQAAPGVTIPPSTRRALVACLPGVAAVWRRPPESSELIVRYVNDASIRRLNQRFKGRDYATDVLAFVTGDVTVSVTTARRQAREEGHSLRRELVHLAVHGLLHLGGWNDATPRQRARMEKTTIAILEAAAVQ